MAKERVAFKIGNLGDNLRLQCPIVGYPAPFFEWKKVGNCRTIFILKNDSVVKDNFNFVCEYSGLSKRTGAKLRELNVNFQTLADWLCIGRPSCLTALGRKFSKRGHFFCTTLYRVVHLFLR